MLYVGTSGFSYKDWVGRFYPERTSAKDMFAFYAKEFSTLEIDYTYYSMPTRRTMEGFAEKSPEGFMFSVRTHQSITHDKSASIAEAASNAARFAEAIEPLKGADKLAAVLIQLPWSFKMNGENISRLSAIASRFAGFRFSVEFRNDSWANQQALELLESWSAALCCVDEPRLAGLFPPIAASTADFAYVRFHGRNMLDWWSLRPGKNRYDYDYSDDELDEWVPGIHKLGRDGKDVYIYMNNCHMGKAARNAQALRRKLMGNA